MTRNMKNKYFGDVMRILLSKEVKHAGFSSLILIIILALIVSHATIAYALDQYLNIHIDAMTTLLIAPLLISSIVLIKEPEVGKKIVTHRVDWDTLLFFIFFFTIVGSLDKTGVLKVFSEEIVTLSGSSTIVMYLIVSLSTGILSVFIANVVTVATLAPILRILGSQGFNIFPTWWGMLFSSVYMGLSTPIGTTASLVLLGILDKRRIQRISINRWMKIGLPIAIIITLFSLVMIYLEFFGHL